MTGDYSFLGSVLSSVDWILTHIWWPIILAVFGFGILALFLRR